MESLVDCRQRSDVSRGAYGSTVGSIRVAQGKRRESAGSGRNCARFVHFFLRSRRAHKAPRKGARKVFELTVVSNCEIVVGRVALVCCSFPTLCGP